MIKLNIDKGCVAYASTAFGASIMNSMFMFYYVKVFFNSYNVSQTWFHISQTIFMIWNAINDPLFGYFQDNSNWKCFKSRRLSILYGAPVFAISFLIPWIPFSWSIKEAVGPHLMFSLCFYDALFTFVLLAHCCLITEMNATYEARLKMKWYGVLASGLLSAWAVPLTNYVSENLKEFRNFQIMTLFIAALGFLSIRYTGLNARTIYDNKVPADTSHSDDVPSATGKDNQGSVLQLTKEILKERDFEAFVWTNFCQIFHSTYLSNFTAIFLDSLADLRSTTKSLYFALLFVMPSLTILFGRHWIQKIGYFNIIKWTNYLKVFSAVVMFLHGYHLYSYLAFLLLDTTSVNAVFSLYDLCLSDISDKDRSLNKRSHPISSMIFGTNALITKPAISLSPMLVTYIISNINTNFSRAETLNADSRQRLGNGMFAISCGIPFFVGLLQIVSWSFYTVRNSHEKKENVSSM